MRRNSMNTFFEDREGRTEKRLRVSFKFSDNMEMCIVGDTIDELITGLERLNKAGLMNEFANRFDLSEEQYGRLDNMILATHNIQEIDRYLRNRRYNVNNVDSVEKALLEIGNVYLISNFSQRKRGKHFKEMEEAIFTSGEYAVIVEFSKIKGADLKRAKDILFTPEALDYCITFYRDHCNVPDLFLKNDLRLLEDWAIKAGDMGCICKLVKVAKNKVDIDKLQEAIIRNGSVYYILEFAKLICDNRNVSKLQEEIINNGDASQILEFARSVKGADIKALYKAIKKKGDKYYIRRFREDVEYNFFWF